MSVIASLALLLRNNLSQRSYKDIRTRTKNVLSSWHELDKLKAEIIPEGIVATRNNVMVPMQSMLNMTVSRILLDQRILKKIYKFKEDNGGEIKVYLIFKYGLDGNTGGMMPQNEGAYDEEDPELRRDPGKMLVSSMVALQLIVIVDHAFHAIKIIGPCRQEKPLYCIFPGKLSFVGPMGIPCFYIMVDIYSCVGPRTV